MPLDLSPYLWKQRVLLVESCSDTDAHLTTQRAILKSHPADLHDRDIVVLEVHKSHFAVILIGKDGGEKRRWTTPVPIAELNAVIDAMPMRQSEIRRKSK